MKHTALITGASSGIGKELAYIHAEKGGDLIIVARREDQLNTIKKDIEEKYKVTVLVLPKDLSNQNAPKEIYETIQNKNIQIEYLINNAGFGGLGKFHERDWEKRCCNDSSQYRCSYTFMSTLSSRFHKKKFRKNTQCILNSKFYARTNAGSLLCI